MALVVDTTKKYRNIPDGQNFTFSLSKPLNQLTAADLQSADSWVGFTCCSINQIYEGKGGEGIPENNPNYCNLWGTDPSWWYDQTNWASVHWSYPANQPTGVYMRNVYVNRELNPGDYTVVNTTARIVLEITPDENTTIQKLCMIDNSNYLQAEYNTSSYDNQMADYTYISPAVLIVVNNCVYLINQNIQRFFVPDNIGFYINTTIDQGYQTNYPSFENLSYHKLAMGWTMGYATGSIEDNCVKTGTGSAPIYTYNDVDFNGHTGILQLTGGGSNYHIRIGCTMSANADDSDFSLIHRAYSGMRFRVNGIWYKPIVEGGIVTGYTDDMTVESEWDTWTKASGHNVPVGPPSPTPSTGDDFDSMVTGFTNNIGGAAKYWLLASEPSGLFEDFFLHAPEGSSITQNILSCYVSALKHNWQTVQHKMVLYTNGSQKPAFESQATYAYIYQGNPHKVLGTIDVPRVTNTFYDFSPYTTYEVYIPFCGWIGLPDIVAGRTIRVYMDFDASICTCKARVECEADGNNVIVGEISGTFGSPCPIQVTEGGLYRQAAINSALQIASGVASGTLGAATKHGGPLAIGGFSYALQGLTNAATAGNTNYSQTIGRSGDSSNLAGTSHYCYLRITHPEVDEVVNNTRFGHTVGYLCNTIGRIGDFEGFTVCGNPHVTGIDCTENEKEEIKRMLEDGIIINNEE